MMTSKKKRVLQQYCDAVGRGDLETVRSLVTDDYTHEFVGSTFLAGKRELHEVLERISAFSSALVSPAKFTFVDMVEEGDLVSGFFTGECELTGGGRFDGMYAIISRFRGDRLLSTREFVDTKLTDSLLGGAE